MKEHQNRERTSAFRRIKPNGDIPCRAGNYLVFDMRYRRQFVSASRQRFRTLIISAHCSQEHLWLPWNAPRLHQEPCLFQKRLEARIEWHGFFSFLEKPLTTSVPVICSFIVIKDAS